jgi:D-psicose/D-tagatose/L-ribulose 3-epimerase
MRIGACLNMNARDPAGVGLDDIGIFAELGYDYIEVPLAQAMTLDDRAFEELPARLARAGIDCEACNNFLPARVRVTGPAVDRAAVMAYAEKALARAARLGAKIVVFGSTGAKNVPPGFSRAEARRQLVPFLKDVAPLAAAHGLLIVVEPVNRTESNLIITEAEGLDLAMEANHPAVKLLVDYNHMAISSDNLDCLEGRGEWLRHAHIARTLGRAFPVHPEEEDYAGFFRRLKMLGYDGSISLEAKSAELRADAGRLRTWTAGPDGRGRFRRRIRATQ